jgi:hypothetical protein
MTITKLILVPFFFLWTIAPTFAVIEIRDTTPTQICDTIVYNQGIVAFVKILSLTDKYVKYKLCDDTTNQSFTMKRTYIRDIKSKEFPKTSANYQADVYKKKATQALKKVIGLLGVSMLLLFLASRLDPLSKLASFLFFLASFCFILILMSIIHFIYLSLKAEGKKQLAKEVPPPK